MGEGNNCNKSPQKYIAKNKQRGLLVKLLSNNIRIDIILAG